MGKKLKDKFQFGLEFQEAILQYTVCDKHGYKALPLYNDSYFTLLSYGFVCMALKRYFKKKKRIPSKVVLVENIRELYNHKDYKKNMTDEFQDDVSQLVDRIYQGIPRDGDDILEQITKFAQYVEFKHEVENVDLEDYTQYSMFEQKIRKAISIGRDLERTRGSLMVAGASTRIIERGNEPDGLATPWWQWNRCLNGGVLKKHSLVMFMGKAKRFKTGVLLNLSRAFMGRRKKGFYIDLENGEANMGQRFDQSATNTDQEHLDHPEMSQKLLKQMRKYRRLGSELLIIRLPALETNCDTIQGILDTYRLEHGIVFNFGIVDYGDLLGAISGVKEDTQRISDAFLDMKNLAERNDLDFLATASHVKNEKTTQAREGTVYQAGDVAKCVDKIRHLDVCWGVQESESEKENGILRLVIVEQRNGPRDAEMYFWANIKHQTMREFNKAQLAELHAQVAEKSPEERKKKVADL